MERDAAGRPAGPSPSLDDRIRAHQQNDRATDEDTLELAVDLFYRRVMADAELEPFFRHIDMSRQRHKLANFMRYILGGAEAYTGRDIWSVHKRMVERQGLRRRHFDLVLQHMEAMLGTLRAPPDVAAQAVAVIRATLPQFRFPPENGTDGERQEQGTGQAGSGAGKGLDVGEQAAEAAEGPAAEGPPAQLAAAEAGVKLEVAPGGGQVALKLRLPQASAAGGEAVQQAAAAAPAGRAAAGSAAGSAGKAGKGAAADSSSHAAVQAGTRSAAADAPHASGPGPPSGTERPALEGGENGSVSVGPAAVALVPHTGAPPATAAQKTDAAAAAGAARSEAFEPPMLLPTTNETVPPPASASKAARPVSASEASAPGHVSASGTPPLAPLLDPNGEDPGLPGTLVQRQLLCVARELWALLSAGLLAGPQMGAVLAVYAAAAALVGVHLAAALASPPGSKWS